jgi:hypothetical protein
VLAYPEKPHAECNRCPWQLAEIWRGAVHLLTPCRDWPIVILDLAIEDIRACEHRGTTGSLESVEMVSEAPLQERVS